MGGQRNRPVLQEQAYRSRKRAQVTKVLSRVNQSNKKKWSIEFCFGNGRDISPRGRRKWRTARAEDHPNKRKVGACRGPRPPTRGRVPSLPGLWIHKTSLPSVENAGRSEEHT